MDGVEQVTAIDWVYDQVGRLTSEDYDAPGTALDYTADYTFDLVGNRLTKTTDRGRDQSIDQTIGYTYDVNDRLLTEVATDTAAVGTTTSYNWQASGLWTTTQLGKTVRETGTSRLISETTYGYNLQGRMSSAVLDTYDAAGTLVAKRESSTFAYNDRSIRTSATLKVEVADAGGVLQVQSDTRTSFLLDEHNPTGYAQVLVETSTDAAGEVQEQKVFTVGLDVIAQATITAATALSGDLYTLLYDGHGSTRLLTNTVGAVAITNAIRQAFAYDAYGNAHGFTPAQAATTLLYSGEQFDQRVQMQYLRARYYDATVGRFTRHDPFVGSAQSPQSYHKYVYGHADPVSNLDPSGKSILGGFISAVISVSQNIADAVGRAFPVLQLVTWKAHFWVVTHMLQIELALSGASLLLFFGAPILDDMIDVFMMSTEPVPDDVDAIGPWFERKMGANATEYEIIDDWRDGTETPTGRSGGLVISYKHKDSVAPGPEPWSRTLKEVEKEAKTIAGRMKETSTGFRPQNSAPPGTLPIREAQGGAVVMFVPKVRIAWYQHAGFRDSLRRIQEATRVMVRVVPAPTYRSRR